MSAKTFTGITGSGTGTGNPALDGWPVTDLANNDFAIGLDSTGNVYTYYYDTASTESESSPDFIIPNDNVSGTGVWILTGLSDDTVKRCEMYLYENTTESTIDAVEQWHGAFNLTEGDNVGFTYDAGATVAISSFTDYSGTVAGTILATTASPHGLTTGGPCCLTGTNIAIGGANEYAGIYIATVVSATTFYFTNGDWNATTTAVFTRPTTFKAKTGSDGTYLFNGTASVAADGVGKTVEFNLFLNESGSNKSEARFENKSSGIFTTVAGSSFLTVAEDDYIWFGVKGKTDATNITIRYANVNNHRL